MIRGETQERDAEREGSARSLWKDQESDSRCLWRDDGRVSGWNESKSRKGAQPYGEEMTQRYSRTGTRELGDARAKEDAGRFL